MPTVTLYENVRPSEAARGSVGLASGMASRWTAGTAMYEAAPHRTEKSTYVPSSKCVPVAQAYECATTIPMVAKRLGASKPKATKGRPAVFRSLSLREAV